jgi:hypothetical protein
MGGVDRRVWLPLEAHGYEAKESLEPMLWEQSRWLDTFVTLHPNPNRRPIAASILTSATYGQNASFQLSSNPFQKPAPAE